MKTFGLARFSHFCLRFSKSPLEVSLGKSCKTCPVQVQALLSPLNNVLQVLILSNNHLRKIPAGIGQLSRWVAQKHVFPVPEQNFLFQIETVGFGRELFGEHPQRGGQAEGPQQVDPPVQQPDPATQGHR